MRLLHAGLGVLNKYSHETAMPAHTGVEYYFYAKIARTIVLSTND